MKQIRCLECKYTWKSKATDLTKRGVYCRNCGNLDSSKLVWVSGYTGTDLQYTQKLKETTDFLPKSQSVKELKKSENIQKDTIKKKGTTEKDIIKKIDEETKKDLLVDKLEKVATKTGKGKYRTRSLNDLFRTLLVLGENIQNKRFENSGYNYRYGEGQSETLREDMLEAFQEAYGVELEMTPQQEFALLSIMYGTPSVYHEVRYKSLGVRMKTWFSKTRAKMKQKQAEKEVKKLDKKEEKKKNKPLSAKEINGELEEQPDDAIPKT